jgi:hypothetical protein
MMKTHQRGSIALALVTFLVGLAWIGAPARAETLKAKVTNYSVKLEFAPAGDVRGHIVGLNTREGIVVFEDGQTADYSMAGTFDYMLGKGGTVTGYTKMTFKDDSLIMFKWNSKSVLDPDKLPTSKGNGTIIGGRGRYKGIKGTVSFSGKQIKPASEDPKREMVVDVVFDYTLNK